MFNKKSFFCRIFQNLCRSILSNIVTLSAATGNKILPLTPPPPNWFPFWRPRKISPTTPPWWQHSDRVASAGCPPPPQTKILATPVLADHFRRPDVLRSGKCSPCLVDPFLISASVFPSFVTLSPRYVNSVTSSMYYFPSLTGSSV